MQDVDRMRLNAFKGLGQLFEQLGKGFHHGPNTRGTYANKRTTSEHDNLIAVEVMQGRTGSMG
tara:strand:- start:308 stop:496 length:189 start_codon:yes stop_codon:yes gene_type:complete